MTVCVCVCVICVCVCVYVLLLLRREFENSSGKEGRVIREDKKREGRQRTADCAEASVPRSFR